MAVVVPRRVWWVGTATLLTAVGVAAAVPWLKLARETALAREMGVPTEIPSTKSSLEFARLSKRWRPIERSAFELPVRVALVRLVEGKAAPQDPTIAKGWIHRAEPSFAAWRTLSRSPRLSLGGKGVLGDPWYCVDAERVREAGRALVTAAVLGHDKRENLLAAAGLSRLLRSEPGFTTVLKGAALGRECLRNAPPGLRREVEAAMGPATDFRVALRPTLSRRLFELAEGEKRRPKGWRESLRRLSPLVFDPRLAAFVRFRTLWQELPGDSHDFEGAARVVRVRMTDLTNVQSDGTAPSFKDNELPTRYMSDGLLAMGRFEALRQTVRR